MELPKQYDPKAVEDRLYRRWEENGYFHEDPDPAHLGHGSTYTPMDVLVRYHRMRGDNADWLPGLDHAAIATEAVVIKDLAREGVSRDDLGRDRFVERAWEWRRTT